ncbi:hypothetical protein [Kribbella monticola]|uniref:hypothetical protein n=1 Tax=Kribbella monticola TaxID=2185285 RepID=UPI0018E51A03|nr:hypothetical protein [Kribbella monticola]
MSSISDTRAMTTQEAGTPAGAATAVAKLIRFLETGVAPDGLFTPDVFIDLTLPQWRVQATTPDELVAIRLAGHPAPGQVRVTRVDPTDRGFTIEFEERWEQQGQQWYSREMIRADLTGAQISELSVYCTGDWDEAKQREHAAAVRLIRP